MSKIPLKEYNEAKDCLKRYNYNCLKIINIREDIMSLSIATIDGMPKAPYSIGDSTINKVIKLQCDIELQKAIREYKAVSQSVMLMDRIGKEIFTEKYQKRNRK